MAAIKPKASRANSKNEKVKMVMKDAMITVK